MPLCVCVLSRVWLFVTPMDYGPPGSSVHGISQARTLEWVAKPSSRGSTWPRDQTHISCISYAGRRFLCHCALWEDHPPPPLSLFESVWPFQVLLLNIISWNQNSLIYFCYQGQKILNTLFNICPVRVSFSFWMVLTITIPSPA